MIRPYTSNATLYWRSLARVQRRAQALSAEPTERNAQLLAQACRTTNRLYWIAYTLPRAIVAA